MAVRKKRGGRARRPAARKVSRARRSAGGREPYQARVDVTLPDGTYAEHGYFPTVPAGRLLVIEFVSGPVFVPPGQKVNYELFTTLDGNPIGHILHVSPTFTQGTYELQHVSQRVKLYSDAGTRVYLRIERGSTSGECRAGAMISGYLIDA